MNTLFKYLNVLWICIFYISCVSQSSVKDVPQSTETVECVELPPVAVIEPVTPTQPTPEPVKISEPITIEPVKEKFAATLDNIIKKGQTLSGVKEKENFCNIINENISAFDNLIIEKISIPGISISGKPFEKPFGIQAFINKDENMVPLENVEFIIEYAERDSNGIKHSFKILTTEEDGKLLFTAPVAKTALKSQVKFYLNLFASADDSTAAETVEIINSTLKQEHIKKISSIFDYKVQTNTKAVLTTIAILDFDPDGKPMENENLTAVRLLRGLMQKGFYRTGLDEYKELANKNDALTVNAAKEKFSGRVSRFIYGRTNISKLEKTDDGKWVCLINANISVWDFKANKKTGEFSASHSTIGKTRWQAFTNARAEIGEKILSDELLYRL